MVERVIKTYGKGNVVNTSDPNAVHEDNLLNLDVTKAYTMLNWTPKLTLEESIEFTVDWYKESLKAFARPGPPALTWPEANARC